jgi:hypothetical protein
MRGKGIALGRLKLGSADGALAFSCDLRLLRYLFTAYTALRH